MISCPYNGHVCSFSCHWLPWYPSITALSKEVRSNSALPVALLGAESTRLRAHLATDSKFGWAIGWHWRKKDCLLHLLWTLVWRCALIKSTLADTSTERGKEWDWSWDAQCFQQNFRHLGKCKKPFQGYAAAGWDCGCGLQYQKGQLVTYAPCWI